MHITMLSLFYLTPNQENKIIGVIKRYKNQFYFYQNTKWDTKYKKGLLGSPLYKEQIFDGH